MAIMMAEPHGKLQQTQFVGRRNKQKRIQGNTNGGSLSLGLVLDTGHRNLMPRLLRFMGSSWFAVSLSIRRSGEKGKDGSEIGRELKDQKERNLSLLLLPPPPSKISSPLAP